MEGRFHTVRAVLAVACAAVLAGACARDEPLGLEDTLVPSFSQSGNWEFNDFHIVSTGGSISRELAERIEALGGAVERSHPEIGVVITSGLSDDAAADLQGFGGVTAVVRDITVQGVPPLEELEWSTQQLPGKPGKPRRSRKKDAQTAGHDPTTAFFFPSQWDMQIIDADDAWNKGFRGSSSVRVAILDTGLDPFHIDMAGNIDMAASVAFVPSVNGAGPIWGDDNFHGTHVGGTVVTNGIGTSGVAPHTTLIAVKVCTFLGRCPFSAIISGLVHAANVNADVVNMSLGGFIFLFAPGGGQLNAALNRAVNFAGRNGTLVVSAAGNSAIDLDHIERDFNLPAVRLTPCENGNGICISATGPFDALAGYSNFGISAISVAAPGGDFVTTFDPFTSMVLSPCSTLSVLIPICSGNGFYLFLQGTSMATPHVVGAAALLDAQSGGASNAGQLKTALQSTADDLGKEGTDPAYGKGRINVCRLVAC
ncbi:MAG: S8 family serine peptidase [Gemmatimonadetes bacterium]|nr:S8 family serine peptidase [Gemmatimonadota bacterium]